LLGAYGPQHWWPADNAFEIIVGALLVQRTAWRNVETAIRALKMAGLLDPVRMHRARAASIERCIRGAGFFRAKAARLRQLAGVIVEHGGADSLARLATPELRSLLLELEGVGPETADAILLYAYDRPAVVVDAYLRRLATRLTAADTVVADQQLRDWVSATIEDADGMNELHALVIEHGKQCCGRKPDCPECPIQPMCATGRNASDA
jgi:endonuclease-3 related protein